MHSNSENNPFITNKPAQSTHMAAKYKKAQLDELILQRPDMYVGSLETSNKEFYIPTMKSEGVAMKKKNITFVPALLKIFDEILVNAADNNQTSYKSDTPMRELKVNFDSNTVVIKNDGKSLPLTLSEYNRTTGQKSANNQNNIPVVELVFGHLLTSSNYDDSIIRTVGGRNGYGAKVTNIYSTKFSVEVCDSNQVYSQVWSKNMKERSNHSMTKAKEKKAYTQVSFTPDLSRFGNNHYYNNNKYEFDKDIKDLFTKRVFDVAGTLLPSGVKVYLNDTLITANNFESYIKLYLKDEDTELIYQSDDVKNKRSRWQMGITYSPVSNFYQVSFVNSIWTMDGGTHVNYILKQITSRILEKVKRSINKKTTLTETDIKNKLFLFVNCLIDNPTFDSQTKVKLTTQDTRFGSQFEVSDAFIKAVMNNEEIMERIMAAEKNKEIKQLKKSDGKKKERLKGVPKLEDANKAGSSKSSSKCYLILTEGDSAKALAMSGLSVVGHDHYGVFPLRGKLLNVREATTKQITNNEEVNSLKQILGLKQGTTYNSVESLRYGHIMIMTDQDQDGSHIKGLIINFIHYYWPSLLKIPGFLTEFITPIVKVWKNTSSGTKKSISFYTIPEYKNWKEKNNDGSGWKIKYYKGLGTSDSKEAKEYFRDIDHHKIPFKYEGKSADSYIELAFAKENANLRKEWLSEMKADTYLNHDIDYITYSDFVNKELILFSQADNVRSIPSIMDGLKPSQRKVLFGCFKKNLRDQIKVQQLCGYISEHSAYHHGGAALSGTIIAMAQNFIGSNNINLLLPKGQFGTRDAGGKNHASERYIYTALSPVSRTIFKDADDPLLNYLDDDGQIIEPEYYMPIIPMILVNGSEGIGTGWATDIPQFNPFDISRNIRRLIKNEPLEPMYPWYHGFKGSIVNGGEQRFLSYGIIQQISSNQLRISELPVGVWTEQYRANTLEKLLENQEIEDFTSNCTDVSASFDITMNEQKLDTLLKGNIYRKFNLNHTIHLTNMVLFDPQGKLRKFSSPEEIIGVFYEHRLPHYQKRRDYLILKTESSLEKILNKMRFVTEVIKGTLDIKNVKRADLLQKLKDKKYKQFPKQSSDFSLQRIESSLKAKNALENKISISIEEIDEEDGQNDEDAPTEKCGYDYLLSMALWSLTRERVEELRNQCEKQQKELDLIKSVSIQQMWLNDLDSFESALNAQYEKDEQDNSAHLVFKAKSNSLKFSVPQDKNVIPFKLPTPKRKRPPKEEKKIESEKLDNECLPLSTQPLSLLDRINNELQEKNAKQKAKGAKKQKVENKECAPKKEKIEIAPLRQSSRAATKKVSYDLDEEDDEEDDDLFLSGSTTKVITKSKEKKAEPKKEKQTKKAKLFNNNDANQLFASNYDFDIGTKDNKKSQKKTTTVKKPKAKKIDLSDEESDNFSDFDIETKDNKKSQKKTTTVKKPKAKKIDLSDKESDNFSDNYSFPAEIPKREVKSRRTAKKVYVEPHSDEDESDISDEYIDEDEISEYDPNDF